VIGVLPNATMAETTETASSRLTTRGWLIRTSMERQAAHCRAGESVVGHSYVVSAATIGAT
jgi:hypothetical protein